MITKICIFLSSPLSTLKKNTKDTKYINKINVINEKRKTHIVFFKEILRLKKIQYQTHLEFPETFIVSSIIPCVFIGGFNVFSEKLSMSVKFVASMDST